MGTGLEIAAIGSLVVGAAATAYSVTQQQDYQSDVGDAQNRLREAEMAAQNEQAARERRNQIREARIQRAQVANLAASTGQGGSSAAIVGGQAASSQVAANIGSINTAMSSASVIGGAQQDLINTQARGPGVASALAGGIGSSLMNYGVQGTVQSIFKK